MIELLKQFCATEKDVREYLRNPFRIGGYVYATNGHVAVRVLNDSVSVEAATEKIHKIERLFSDAHCNPITPIAIPPLPDPVKCKECSGTGFVYETECDECSGNGWFTYGSHDYDCNECDGDGYIAVDAESNQDKKTECYSCDGTGNILHQEVQIGDSKFSRRYLAIISTLPNVRFVSIKNNAVASGFVFDGGEGIIMPLRY